MGMINRFIADSVFTLVSASISKLQMSFKGKFIHLQNKSKTSFFFNQFKLKSGLEAF